MKLQFLGAVRQVTGSQYYFEVDGAKVLVDCGLYQERELLSRNWDPSPVPLHKIDAVVLTHAHLDHCGLAPRLVHEGLRAQIMTTPASADLVEIVLYDAAHIQMEDAAFKQKRHRKENRTVSHPVAPLYTTKDVDRTIPLIERVPYGVLTRINDGLSVRFHDAGHILGSAMLEFIVDQGGPARRVVFSGDIGQWDRPIVRNPTTFTAADYIVMETTYGDRDHEQAANVEDQLADVIGSTVAGGGKVIVPIFAIERAQELIFYLGRLIRSRRIPSLPVFLDSPMAVDVAEVFRHHRDCFNNEAEAAIDAGQSPLSFPGLKAVRSVQESKQLNHLRGPAVILATSGMCTAGRIKHHLAQHISQAENTVLFVGYQARGTLGRQILDGNPEVRIHGRNLLVRARVAQIHGISGHADRTALVRWLSSLKQPPRRLFLTHGEEQQALAFAQHVRDTLGWENVTVPQYREVFELD